ncbi:MAG TPA: hypothetical protein VNE58_07730, partial [Casimicrobiaceae bacterium]|nr:hypothetical protein [Casimicrobiaceae bacterium]
LSTVHETRDSDRRKLVYCANRLLRREYRLPFRSTAETGVLPYCKQTVYRAFRRFGLVETPKRRVYLTALRLDASAEEGMASIAEGPVLTEFSQKDFRLERDAAGKLNVVEA